jgi:outer membrane protein insertion porin family
MNLPKVLMRGVVMALALLMATPLAGTGGPLGASAALAQNSDPLVASVLFEGNQGFSDSQLLAMVDVATRGIASPSVIAADEESIRIAYQEKGYANVSVGSRLEQTSAGRVLVIFVISEGARAGIAAINFTGNNSIDAGTLKSVIRTRETHILSWLFRDDAYNPQLVAIDKELIRVYYGNRGFPDAVVTSAVAEFDPARNAYFLNFTISEGNRYSFGDISIETSIPGLNADALTGSVRTREGGRYSLADLEKTQADMAFEATAQGYPFADVRPRVTRDLTNNIFNVTYLVDEGPRIYIERIEISGNEKTRDFVIRRELEFAEGDPFNRSMLQRGKIAIEALGYFSAVSVDLQPGSASDKVVILITVVEQSTGDYGATVGWASDQGILGEVSVTERNFLGRGQYLRAALGLSGSGRSFDLSFTEPRLAGLKISSGIDLYHRVNSENDVNFYGSTATGGQLRIGLPVTRDVNVGFFGGVESKSFVDTAPPTSTVAGALDGVTRNKFWIGYNLVYNGVDDVKRPTEGIYATFSQQYIGWDYSLLKTEAKARWFFPIMEDSGIIGSVKGQAGIIYSFSGAVSPLEAFTPSSSIVRGFASKGFGPKTAAGESIGTTAYAAISGEISFPLPVVPETYGLKGAVWADAAVIGPAAGTVAVDPLSVDQPLKGSVGASIIWDGPFGPIRGDVGYAHTKATTDTREFFQLTIQNLI